MQNVVKIWTSSGSWVLSNEQLWEAYFFYIKPFYFITNEYMAQSMIDLSVTSIAKMDKVSVMMV